MRHDIPRFTRMLEDGVVDAKPIITRVYPLDEINDALGAAETRENLTGVIVPLDARVSPARAAVPLRRAACRSKASARNAAPTLAEYRVLSEGGWWDVRKCQTCLASLSESRRRGSAVYAARAADRRCGLRQEADMLGVDVGGTFTDVVSIRDGRIEVTKVRATASRPPQRSSRARGGSASRAAPSSTTRARWASTRSSPGGFRRSRFLTTEGFRDMLDRGRVWRPLDGQTDPSWRRSFGDAARPLVPRYLRRGFERADPRRRQRDDPSRRGCRREDSSPCWSAAGRGRGDLPDQLATSTQPTRSGFASLRRRCSAIFPSRSPLRPRRSRRSMRARRRPWSTCS